MVRPLRLARRPFFVHALRRVRLYVALRLLYEGLPSEEWRRWKEVRAFRKGPGALLRHVGGSRSGPVVLFPLMSIPGLYRLRIEGLMAKALEARDCRSVFVIDRHDLWTEEHLRAFGFDEFVYYDDYVPDRGGVEAKAAALLETCTTLTDVLELTHRGIDVGKHAASRTLGRLRTGILDLEEPHVRENLIWTLTNSMIAAEAFHGVHDVVAPDKLVTSVQNLTPWAEFYNGAVLKNVDMLFYFPSHHEEAFLFRRYGYDDRYAAYFTLTDEAWANVKQMAWTRADADAFLAALRQSYEDAGRSKALRDKRVKTPDEIRAELDLDPAKKTAFIFSHVLHDAPFWFGENLFSDFGEWLVETVKAAADNENLNWVVRVHPENLRPWESRDDESGVDTLEERVLLAEAFESLPAHVKLMPPESDTNTVSLFDFADYALTVRGTVGLEFPCFGVPTLTAGTGGYSGRGFTIDSATRDEYLGRLATLHDVGPLDEHAIALAQRFSYALFQLKPVKFTTFTAHLLPREEWDLGHNAHSFELNVSTAEEFVNAPDFGKFADWALDPSQEQLLGTSVPPSPELLPR